MRIFILVIAFTFSACKKSNVRVEDKLYDCMMNELSEQEKASLKPIIIEFEQT